MLNPINASTWLASDPHFGHKNIADYEPLRGIWKDLGYSSMEDMIIKKHNEVVKPDDSVLFLGDFSWDNPQNWIHKLNGKKYLILGNHDRKGDTSYIGFEGIFRGIYIDVGAELFKNDSVIDPLLSAIIMKYNKQLLIFSHYAIGYKDVYDHQKEGGIDYIELRKKKILEVLRSYNKNRNLECINIHGHLHSHKAIDNTVQGISYRNVCLEQSIFYPQRLRDVV